MNWQKIVKELRQKFGESQERFAKRLNTTQFSVCRWETGKQKPSFMAQKLITELKEKINGYSGN